MNKKICDDCPFVLDTLTGLIRRELFVEKLKDNKNCDTLVVCDIDFFKSFNDTYGHLAGDLVLKEFAALLKEKIRKNEIVARFGGEEFVLALSGGITRAEEFFQEVSSSINEINYQDNTLPKVTFSAGSSVLYDDIWAAFSKADKAVYFSKENGRDQINHYEQIYKFIERENTKKENKKTLQDRATGYAVFSLWDREKVLYEKGSKYVNKKLSGFEEVLKKEFDVVDIFRTKELIISMVFKKKKDSDTRLKVKRLTKEYPDMSGVLNFYPGITSFAYLERDTFNAFISLSFFKENQGIILYSVKALRNIGVYHFKRSEYKSAYEYFRRAYRIQKNDFGIMNLAAAMIKIERFKSAIILLKSFKEILLKFEDFFVNLSLCHYKMKNYDKALETLREGSRRFPESNLIKKNIKELQCLEKD